MDCVRVTGEFGIVIRLASLNEQGIPLEKLLIALETSSPFDSNAEIASFGPHFGAEALETLVRRLSDLGLNTLMISLNFREIFRSGAFLEYPRQVRRSIGTNTHSQSRRGLRTPRSKRRLVSLIKRGATIIGGPKPANRTMSLPRRTRSPRANLKDWWSRC
jgi:hypothetical protein